MTYLEEAAEQLRKARDEDWALALHAGFADSFDRRTAMNERRIKIADGFIRLAAIERVQPEDPAFPHEPELRIGAALETARAYGNVGPARHKQWVIDQMVRGLTAADVAGDDLSGEYRAFVARVNGEWDEGIEP